MAKRVLVLEEVLGIMAAVGISNGLIDKFRQQAEFVTDRKNERSVDEVTVGSGFGQKSQQGFVDLTLNQERSQLPVKKAREIGLMLLEAAEAAQSDEMFLRLLDRIAPDGFDDRARGRILLDLREIRQGTRGVSFPT